MNNRENRVGVMMMATISSDNFFFEGMVQDVSRNGFKMADIPTKFDPKSAECVAVISNKGKSYKLNVRPTWSSEAGIQQVVGFQIISPPSEWIYLMDELDPQEKDIWGFRAG